MRLVAWNGLVMFPLTGGSGPRLFTDGADAGKFTLAKCESYDNGVVYLNDRAVFPATA